MGLLSLLKTLQRPPLAFEYGPNPLNNIAGEFTVLFSHYIWVLWKVLHKSFFKKRKKIGCQSLTLLRQPTWSLWPYPHPPCFLHSIQLLRPFSSPTLPKRQWKLFPMSGPFLLSFGSHRHLFLLTHTSAWGWLSQKTLTTFPGWDKCPRNPFLALTTAYILPFLSL